MGLCSPSVPSVLNAPIRSQSTLNGFKRSKPCQDTPKRSETFPEPSERFQNVTKHSPNAPKTFPNIPNMLSCLCLRLLIVSYIHMGLCCPACLACQTLTYDPNTLGTHSSDSKTLHAAPKHSQTFTSSVYAYVYLHTIILYHTISYRIMLTIPPYRPQKCTYGIGLATCIKFCMCSSFRRAPTHEAYVFHARSTLDSVVVSYVRENTGFDHWVTRVSRALVSFNVRKNTRFDHWVTRVSRALVRLLLGDGSAQIVPKCSQIIPKDAKLFFRTRIERTNETGHVELSDSQSVWRCLESR